MTLHIVQKLTPHSIKQLEGEIENLQGSSTRSHGRR